MQARVKQTTQAINRLHNLLARVFPELVTLTDDIAAAWVLRLLDAYPTAELIARADRDAIARIPHLSTEHAQALHQAAGQSVATLKGPVTEALVRTLVTQVRQCQQVEKELRKLLTTTFSDLPSSPHVQVVTIPGIGEATAAVLVAKIVDINRFATPNKLVSYFGIFPEENTSGVDKQGHPLPPGTRHMSRKGNDLARAYLWNATRTAICHNPAVRALYRRLRAKGKRGDVALGHCMRKLLHLVFAVWKTDRPFDPKHFAWEGDGVTESTTPTSSDPGAATTPSAQDKTVGHKQDEPVREVVTTAVSTVAPAAPPVKPPSQPISTTRPKVDFQYLREQVTMEQVLQHLGLLGQPARPWSASQAAVLVPCTATPEPQSERSPSTLARMHSSASTRSARSRETCWISGPRSIVCRSTTPPSTWPRHLRCPETEKRNPLREPVLHRPWQPRLPKRHCLQPTGTINTHRQ